MYYTIYKTTCLFNGKFYIGKHQTKNLSDGYFGSGKLLVRAVKKHGIENFVTEVIAVYKTEHEMNLAEKILVVVDPEISYNLCSGGHGGFSYINRVGLRTFDLNTRPIEKLQQSRRKGGQLGWSSSKSEGRKERVAAKNRGKKHSEAAKQKISLAKRGRSIKQPKPPWNKGLTKKTDERLAKLSDTNRRAYFRQASKVHATVC